MAIGDTINAGLMRVDFSPIARAGQAQARANQAFGQAIGGVIEKFYQKKKDKQEREEREQAYRQMGLSDEEAKAASRDKDLANQFINKMNADRNYDLQVDQFNEASALRNLQMDQLRRNMDRQKDADQLADKARKKEEAQAQIYDRFLIDREMVNMPIGGGETNHLMKNVPPPTIQVPRGEYKGNRFFQTEQGKSDFTSLVDAGIDASDALEIAGKREAQLLASQPKPLSPSDQLARERFEYEKSKDLNKPIPLTDGEKARDRKFADQLVEFNLPDINKGLEQLTEASEALSKSNTLSGPIVSLLPNFVGDRLNPEATEVREAVEEVVQRNLRLVLGAQFTEKEGERLISRAYNPRLDEAENKKRVERLIKSIKDAAQEKINMKSYFEKNGTLKGYNSNMPSIKSIELSAFNDSAPASQSLLDEIERKKQLRSKRAGL